MVLSAFVLGLGFSVGNIKGATVQCVCVYVHSVSTCMHAHMSKIESVFV